MDVLEQLKSALTGRYEIEREIGQGGMATVYLARDVRHGRRVALKLLNPELGAVVGVERFLAEIRVTANLQHPNLLPLFDSGAAEGHLFYVMPYVEGESLRAKLQREKQLPIEEAIHVATAVASALDYAHRHGVIHRDLKPENILLHDGQPMVADFGIALALSNAGGNRITQTGLSLGTPQYMSPEQATGDRAIDGRTDIYSLGAVLYEMLCGDPPHTGSTAQAIIAKVITDRPRSVRLSRDSVSEQIEYTIEKALAKLPADRFASAHEFADALLGKAVVLPSGISTPGSLLSPAVARKHPWIRRAIALAPWVVATASALALVAVLLRPKPEPKPSRFLLAFSDSTRFRGAGGPTIALSPDGSRMVFVGGPESGGQLYVRDLNDLEAKPISGTERGYFPTFSPDGRSLLFVADGAIKRIGVEGGTPVMVSDSGAQPTWGERDLILFAVRGGGISRTSSNGGTASLVARADTTKGITSVAWPHLLPGGKAALLTIFKGAIGVANASLGVVTISDGVVHDLAIAGANPRYLPTGDIIFGRADGAVYGAPFDVDRLRVTGAPVQLLQNVVVKTGGATEVAVSRDGTLMYRSGQFARRMVLVNRHGAESPYLQEMREYNFPRVSPDGKRVAVTVSSATSVFDIWVFDTQTGALTRVTQNGGQRPEWTPDGRNILTIHADSGYRNVFTQPWDASGLPSLYLTNPKGGVVEISVPRRGRGFLAVRVGARVGAGGRSGDIMIAPVDSPRALRPFLATAAIEIMPSVSPDGDQLAYVSDESGRVEVYVRPMPGPGSRVQVSTDGGSEPVWSPTGRELFYRANGKIIAARITWQGGAAAVSREVLFDDVYFPNVGHANYSVMPDGDHFLFAKSAGGDAKTVVVLNWFEEVRQRMASAKRN
ncbi:MAG TPA: protein kinase [Gemmatimonadaceae bacterium]